MRKFSTYFLAAITTAFLITLAGAASAQAATIYVSPAGGGDGSVATSPTDLQSALDSAAAGDVLMLSQGLFTPATSGDSFIYNGEGSIKIQGQGVNRTRISCEPNTGVNCYGLLISNTSSAAANRVITLKKLKINDSSSTGRVNGISASNMKRLKLRKVHLKQLRAPLTVEDVNVNAKKVQVVDNDQAVSLDGRIVRLVKYQQDSTNASNKFLYVTDANTFEMRASRMTQAYLYLSSNQSRTSKVKIVDNRMTSDLTDSIRLTSVQGESYAGIVARNVTNGIQVQKPKKLNVVNNVVTDSIIEVTDAVAGKTMNIMYNTVDYGDGSKVGSGEYGIQVTGSDVNILNNAALGEYICGVGALSGSSSVYENYNASYEHRSTPVCGSLTSGGTTVASDPLFVDAANGNYKLQTGSPLIDVAGEQGVMRDLDRNTRPSLGDPNGGPDIGAYEKQ